MPSAKKNRSTLTPEDHVVSTSVAAKYLGITSRWIQQLATDGWVKPIGRGRWNLSAVMKAYAASMKDGERRSSKSAAENRVRDARAAEIERRMARDDRTIIALDEAMAAHDHATGLYLQSVSGLPARITRNASERRRLEAICDTERQRLATRFAEGASALRTSVDAFEAGDEGDAG